VRFGVYEVGTGGDLFRLGAIGVHTPDLACESDRIEVDIFRIGRPDRIFDSALGWNDCLRAALGRHRQDNYVALTPAGKEDGLAVRRPGSEVRWRLFTEQPWLASDGRQSVDLFVVGDGKGEAVGRQARMGVDASQAAGVDRLWLRLPGGVESLDVAVPGEEDGFAVGRKMGGFDFPSLNPDSPTITGLGFECRVFKSGVKDRLAGRGGRYLISTLLKVTGFVACLS
jgi:hypothetical protein